MLAELELTLSMSNCWEEGVLVAWIVWYAVAWVAKLPYVWLGSAKAFFTYGNGYNWKPLVDRIFAELN